MERTTKTFIGGLVIGSAITLFVIASSVAIATADAGRTRRVDDYEQCVSLATGGHETVQGVFDRTGGYPECNASIESGNLN